MKALTPQDKLQIDKARQVYQLQLCNPKMTQEKACANIGIAPKTYRKWIATQDEAIAELEKTRQEIERNELASILTSISAVTDNFIREAMKPGLSITERIKALEYINNRMVELSDRYHTVDVEAEQILLSGPKQTPGISRLASRINIVEEGNETVIKDKDNPEVADNQGDQTDKSENS
jgi:hypothetical protein